MYSRIYQHDTQQAEEELQTFLQELYHMDNRNQERILNATNQKIAEIQQEEGITAFGGLKKSKKGKTGKKRKRSSRKTNKKITNKKRKRRI